MQSYYTNQDNSADQRNSAKNKWKDYMKSEDKWVFRENILQTFVQMQKQEKKAAIAVAVHVHVAVLEMQMKSWFLKSQRK